jgi:choice-of-anchor A domain-containing protein
MRTFPRLTAMLAALGIVSVALVAAPSLGATPASPAAAVGTAVCGFTPSQDYPNLNAVAPLTRFDSALNVMVGRDFGARAGAAEGEGVFAVGRNADFDTGLHFSLGVAGVGSRVAPPALSDMLTTGGDVTVPSGVLDVGFSIGGDVVSGGTVTPTSSVVVGQPPAVGTITQNAVAPLLPYAPEITGYADLSRNYAAMPQTPGASVLVSGWQVEFTGDGTSSRQVFTVAGDQLGALGDANTKSMVFAGIPAGAIVVVNVTGSTAMVGANTFSLNGAVIDPTSTTDTRFSDFTQSLLWNFPQADAVTLGDEDQLLGSVLVPRPTSTVTVLTSTNGRFYAGGDVIMGGSSQVGLEFHAYPFREVSCAAVTDGRIAITKSLTDPDGVVGPARVYTGTYSCSAPSLGVVASGPWSLTAGGPSFIAPLVPAGSVCTVAEDALSSPPTARDASYVWKAPVVSPASTTVVTSATPSVVTVGNEVRRAVGSVELVKVLDDPYDVVDAGRVYTGTFECRFADGTAPLRGTWSERAGSAPVLLASGLPIGTVCTLAEDPLVAPPLAGFPQYQWDSPRISPATVTVVENVVGRFTVTNVVVDPVDAPRESTPAARASLPVTGGEATFGPLLVAAVMLLLGLVGLVIKNRQHGSSRRNR